MNQISLEKLLAEYLKNGIMNRYKIIRKIILKILAKMLYLKTVNAFLDKNSHLDAKHFINELFDELNFSYMISDRDIQKIPSESKLIIVANHPLGSLDSLSLLKAVMQIRNDVKIVANDVLVNIDNIRPLLLPFNLSGKKTQKENLDHIGAALENDCAVIIFPAASVSRMEWFRIVDSKWHKGAIYFAKKYCSPVTPVFINAKNSMLFYVVSMISRKLSMFLLVHELFNKKNRTIQIKVGELIPAKVFTSSFIKDDYQMKLLKKHVYLLGKNKSGIYNTEKNVIHPIDRRLLKRELNNSQLIGTTREGMKIYITTKDESPYVISEIARLREITFRKVGEGTGKKMDIDKFDSYYSHLIIWDENELEIVGSYRIGLGNYILQKYGREGFYTSSLFDYNGNFVSEYLANSIELGRSFIQKKYWNTNALNYLWYGIGAYLANNPSVKYLFGGVSISNSYPECAKELIIYFFTKWYSSRQSLSVSRNKYVIPERTQTELYELFNSGTVKGDFKILKNMLKPLGLSVPVLYKHYTDLCVEEGTHFLDFGTDPDFENCVDGLILIDVDKIKEEKKQKYIGSYIGRELKETA